MGVPFSKPSPSYGEKLPSSFPSRPLEMDDDAPPPYSASTSSPYKTSLSLSKLRTWETNLLQDPKNRLAITTLSTTPYPKLLQNQHTLRQTPQIFNTTIPLEGAPITDQRSSGRCWLFAATNVFRVPLMKRYQLDSFQLSQAYLFYWDKLEKANYFLTQMIDTADAPLDGRLVQELLSDPLSDGGQWDMLANLVDKYGLVPHDVFPDPIHATASSKMDWLLTAKLREQALALRRLARGESVGGKGEASLSSVKEGFLREIHAMVTLMLGPPPAPDEEFTWEYVDRSGKAVRVVDTPRAFAGKAFARAASRPAEVDPTGMLSLVNDPRNEYGRLLTVDRLGNVVEGRPITYINVDMETMKRAAIAMLRAGHPVFFGCDVGKSSDSTTGIMDTKLLDLELGFNVTLGMSKAERVSSGESAMTHAMVLTAVHVEDGKPVRWRVQNSWGESAGEKGWFVMSDAWMDQYTYQVVVDPRFVSREVRDVLKQEPVVLPRWDPMGVLA